MIEQYARMYQFYRSALMRTIRLLFLVLLLLVIFSEFSHSLIPRIALFLLTLFLMVETFFHFKVARIQPTVNLDLSTPQTRHLSFTMPLLYAEVSSSTADQLINR